MGTTINGVYTGAKRARRERVIERLKAQLKSKEKTVKSGKEPLTDKDKERINKEIRSIEDILSGVRGKKVVSDKGEVVEAPKEKWFIDIYAIHMSYSKNSDRRKNKGKSRKKMRKVRSTSFVKSVVAQPGMIQSYRDGKMGVSPKLHSFRMRKEEPSFL